MTGEDLGDEAVFVVRFWRRADAAWRGSVDHIASGERRFFVDLAHLDAFIEAHLDSSDARRTIEP